MEFSTDCSKSKKDTQWKRVSFLSFYIVLKEFINMESN